MQLFSYIKLDVKYPVHAASYTPFHLKIYKHKCELFYKQVILIAYMARVGYSRNIENILILKYEGKRLRPWNVGIEFGVTEIWCTL